MSVPRWKVQLSQPPLATGSTGRSGPLRELLVDELADPLRRSTGGTRSPARDPGPACHSPRCPPCQRIGRLSTSHTCVASAPSAGQRLGKRAVLRRRAGRGGGGGAVADHRVRRPRDAARGAPRIAAGGRRPGGADRLLRAVRAGGARDSGASRAHARAGRRWPVPVGAQPHVPRRGRDHPRPGGDLCQSRSAGVAGDLRRRCRDLRDGVRAADAPRHPWRAVRRRTAPPSPAGGHV